MLFGINLVVFTEDRQMLNIENNPQEIQNVTRALKTNNSPGFDGLPA